MFVGRTEELESLNGLWKKSIPSLVTCRGRRRIGKSTLVEQFARQSDARLIVIDGLPPHGKMTNREQLANFALKLSVQSSVLNIVPEDWFSAFRMLDSALDDSRRTVVLLDEISWMGRCDGSFPGQLKSAWDLLFKRHRNLIVVLCGSVSAWIRRNILDNTGFVGRISKDIVLDELSLSESAAFWGARRKRLAPSEILDVLTVTGGVPRYLEEVDPSLSADENIRNLCFSRDGLLFDEFNQIFSGVFGAEAEQKGAVLRALCDRSMTGVEISETLGVSRGGSFTDIIDALVEAGFVARDCPVDPATGKRARSPVYRLKDNYARFYLKYVEPNAHEIASRHYRFNGMDMLPGWRTILGLQLENLVVNNVRDLLRPLRLEGVPILSAAPYRRNRTTKAKGCQIDLLIQSRKSVCLVEVKHREEIGEEVESEVAEKIACLGVPPNKTVRAALVYLGELKPVVRGNAYFDALISFADLLK